ncbi:Uncharacterized protein OBRU01_15755, partial [Operophtera brumata]
MLTPANSMPYVYNQATAHGTSDIQQFYCNSTVFITGGSGFIGKQLVEKLFREQKPGFTDRITSVEGDIAEMRLGVCELDWNMMAEEVDVIFHVAATTKFDEHIREAALINVRGTREALQLGRACKKLRGGDVLEQFYESPLSPETLIQMAEQAVAEEQVRLMSSELPLCIVRPSVVPVDFVNNALIAAGWAVGARETERPREAKLSESDRVIFNFDMTVLNWPEMVNLWCIGVRKYILKDGLINTEKAVRKQLWFGILNYLILAISGYVAWII